MIESCLWHMIPQLFTDCAVKKHPGECELPRRKEGRGRAAEQSPAGGHQQEAAGLLKTVSG